MIKHVQHHLYLHGGTSYIKDFLRKAGGKNKLGFTFNSFKKLDFLLPDSYKTWDHYRIVNWGTDNDCYDVEVEDNFGVPILPPVIKMKTAWTLPQAIFLEMSRQAPDVTFNDHYIINLTEEAGMFCFKNGKILQHEREIESTWVGGKSQLIHSLNCRYQKEAYISALQQRSSDAKEFGEYDCCEHYLALIKKQEENKKLKANKPATSEAISAIAHNPKPKVQSFTRQIRISRRD